MSLLVRRTIMPGWHWPRPVFGKCHPERARRRGETNYAYIAYERFADPEPARYQDGWLPD
jgi:hypothetical protein